MEYGECNVLYTNPDYIKFALGAWSAKNYEPIERIYSAIIAEYNPVHNYDRHEEYTDNTDGEVKQTGTVALNLDGTVANSVEGNATTTNEISAYNSSTYQPNNETTYDDDRTTTDTYNRTDTTTYDKTDTNTENKKHNGHLYGNIGVTESSTMVSHEIDLRLKYNLYHIISEMLYRDFCLYYF